MLVVCEVANLYQLYTLRLVAKDEATRGQLIEQRRYVAGVVGQCLDFYPSWAVFKSSVAVGQSPQRRE